MVSAVSRQRGTDRCCRVHRILEDAIVDAVCLFRDVPHKPGGTHRHAHLVASGSNRTHSRADHRVQLSLLDAVKLAACSWRLASSVWRSAVGGLSRRDLLKVAWHEVPGKRAMSEPSR
jgi:hypothetical protein